MISRHGCRKMSFAHWTFVVIALALLLGITLPASAEPLRSEKVLPADPVVAVIFRDCGATGEHWRTTALYEVLQDPEMKEMLKPLRDTLQNLYATVKAMSPVPFEPLQALTTGEFGFGIAMVMGRFGPEPVFQLVAVPKDMEKARLAVIAFADSLVKLGVAEPVDLGKDAIILDLDGAALMATFTDNLVLLTFCSPNGASFHEQALARQATGEGGLARDGEYAAVRSVLGEDFEGWAYIGVLPWMKKNMAEVNPAAPFLEMLGLSQIRGIIAGVKVEDRGFRTRAFARREMEFAGKRLVPAVPPITAADLAEVPSDSVGFSMGPVNLVALYDRIMNVLMMVPGGGMELRRALTGFERALGLNIRNDVLGIFGKRYLHFTPEPGSPAGSGGAVFLAINDRKTAEGKLKALMDGIVGAIRNEAGPNTDGFVRIRTLDRGAFTQIYPQSVLPASVTPTLAVSDKWTGIGLSARATLPMMRHLLRADKTGIASRKDFAAVAQKLPSEYNAISYVDVGQCFGNLLGVVQFVSDLAAIGVKSAAAAGELPIPVSPAALWGMDPGRFPDEALFREKLFGSVSVVSYRPDGILFENFSPIGPIPVPKREFKLLGGQSQVATTAILAGMLLPALARARGQARAVASMNNMKQIMVAIITYQEPNQENIPPTLADLVPAYIDNPRVFVAPWDNNPFAIKNGFRCSYRYIGNVPFRDVGPNQFILYERIPRNGMRTVAHFDGHVRRYPEGLFRQQLAQQYADFQQLMQAPDFPGNKERAKAFFEDRDFAEQ